MPRTIQIAEVTPHMKYRISKQSAFNLVTEVLIKQKGEKAEALSRILEDYKVMMDIAKEDYYQIIPIAKCKKCGGMILKRTRIFSRMTYGGNPVIGCPICKTFSSGKMLYSRDDIQFVCSNGEEI